MSGNCPYCNGLITSPNVGQVNAAEDNGKTWKAVMFTCPFCRKVIGVAFDQTSHTNFIVDEIKKIRTGK